MQTKIGIGIIQGMGTQGEDFARTLINDLKSYYGEKHKEEELYFRPIYWADILEKAEDTLWKNLKMEKLSYDKLRYFVVHYLADSIAYQKMYEERQARLKDDRKVYFKVQERISEALLDIKNNTPYDSPLILISHSLGSVMLLNYIYDSQKSAEDKKKIYWNHKIGTGNLAGLVMCGSPFALWSLRKGGFGQSIRFPGDHVSGKMKAASSWLNFYDKDDVLGFPVKNINDSYNNTELLSDIQVEVDDPVLGWSPLSHEDYFQTIKVIKRISDLLVNVRKNLE